jgi:hypothetical protein
MVLLNHFEGGANQQDMETSCGVSLKASYVQPQIEIALNILSQLKDLLFCRHEAERIGKTALPQQDFSGTRNKICITYMHSFQSRTEVAPALNENRADQHVNHNQPEPQHLVQIA